MIKKVLTITRQSIFHDQEAGRNYRRVVGGVAWPTAGLPGWVVVVGEALLSSDGLQGRKLYVLQERQAEGLEDLLRQCLAARIYTKCEEWRGQTKGRPEMVQWRRLNVKRFALDRQIYLREAIHAGDRALVLFHLVDNLVIDGQKVLHFGDHSELAQIVRNLQMDNLRAPLSEIPALAALGYALGDLLLREPAVANQEIKCVTTWNPYALEV